MCQVTIGEQVHFVTVDKLGQVFEGAGLFCGNWPLGYIIDAKYIRSQHFASRESKSICVKLWLVSQFFVFVLLPLIS